MVEIGTTQVRLPNFHQDLNSKLTKSNMNIKVRVTANSKTPSVVMIDESNYRVRVNAPAIEGIANRRLIEILAGHFQIPKSKIRILKGAMGRDKVLEIGK